MNAEKYTQKTLDAVKTAQSMAQENGNQYLTPEHLLYALIDADGGLIGTLLGRMGVDCNAVLSELDTAIDLCKAGKPLEARGYIMTVCRKYMHFFNEPTKEGLPSPWLAIIKEGLTMRGIPIGLPRRPIHPLPDSVRAELTAVMRDFGYYKLG